jgi:hypothetical protein
MSNHSYDEIRESVEKDLYEELGRFPTEDEIDTAAEEASLWVLTRLNDARLAAYWAN